MNVIIDDYEPMGNQVLLRLEIKGTTESGIIMNKKQADKWMEVVKVGDGVNTISVGDLAIMGEPRGMAHMNFGDESYIQVAEFDIIGKVPIGNQTENQLQLNMT